MRSTSRTSEPLPKEDRFVIAITKGAERYIFIYDAGNRAKCLRQLGRFAANSELSFTWCDAAVLSRKIREEVGHAG